MGGKLRTHKAKPKIANDTKNSSKRIKKTFDIF